MQQIELYQTIYGRGYAAVIAYQEVFVRYLVGENINSKETDQLLTQQIPLGSVSIPPLIELIHYSRLLC